MNILAIDAATKTGWASNIFGRRSGKHLDGSMCSFHLFRSGHGKQDAKKRDAAIKKLPVLYAGQQAFNWKLYLPIEVVSKVKKTGRQCHKAGYRTRSYNLSIMRRYQFDEILLRHLEGKKGTKKNYRKISV